MKTEAGEAFDLLDIRCGTVIKMEAFPEARNPSFKVWIDFGELGIKKTSARITDLYQVNELIGKQVIALVNPGQKQIANFISECLILGCTSDGNNVVLLQPERPVINGTPIK